MILNRENLKASIMIIDDTPANLKLLESMLVDYGHRVFSFPRGELAINAARRNPPDLILLDVNMPQMNGYEVCSQLKADPMLADIPVIFISAMNETLDKVKAFSVGGVDYITKPFQLHEVEARVETHLKLRTLQRELQNYTRDLESLVEQQVREISESQMATIYALAKLAESRDDETGRHVERVQMSVRLLGAALMKRGNNAEELDEVFVEFLTNATPLHDIGKVGIPDAILLKPGRLTAEEFEVMKRHSLIGAETLSLVYARYPHNRFLRIGIDVARSHHERWNGTGYPDGLSGKEIPLSARIVAVADVYDALRTSRCYKEAFSRNKSRGIILQEAGQQFDDELVEAFMDVEEELSLIYDHEIT
ncbi:MAG TPA: response regulator [Anaerolineaceae bacterium]|nr:response regulator [Anaerolineaceae bacterium]HPN54237.1 response regulator [Anaerolineaceae bacterium]